MKIKNVILICAVLAGGGYWIVQNNPNALSLLEQYIDNGEILTFEARYTPERILDQFSKELALGEKTFQRSELKFYPYAFLDVKYSTADKRTKEGVLLWSLFDGEMVINCETWENTHGFEDAINAQATRNDFKILNALAKNKGKASLEQLQRDLQVEADILQPWLDESKAKYLVVQKGNEIQLHFQNPRLLVVPQTSIMQSIVTKPYSQAQKMPRNYSFNQIEKTAQAAFGQDFTIRNKKELFLPVYSIEILNPDGSVLTTEWNALNGQRMIPRYLTNTP